MECNWHGNIETIAAANAAYAVIKKFAETAETANLAKSVGQFLQAEDDLREQVSKEKQHLGKALGKDANTRRVLAYGTARRKAP